MSKFLSRADLERLSSTVVNQYYQAIPMVGMLPVPVDPVRLAKLYLGLEVSYFPLSADGSVLGLACFHDTELQVQDGEGEPYSLKLTDRDIVIDTSLLDDGQTGRHNFTAAHELAHHILVRLYPEDYRHLLDYRTHILYRRRGQMRDWEEWQADTMAAAIIMPKETLRHCMFVFGLGEKLDMVSSVCRPKQYDRFCDIATYLGVSKKALAIRMKQLGLVEKVYLEHPAAPLDIWYDEEEQDV